MEITIYDWSTSAGHRHDPVVGPQHRSPQPVQSPRGAARVRLPGVRRPPALGRLDLSSGGHAVIGTHALN